MEKHVAFDSFDDDDDSDTIASLPDPTKILKEGLANLKDCIVSFN